MVTNTKALYRVRVKKSEAECTYYVLADGAMEACKIIGNSLGGSLEITSQRVAGPVIRDGEVSFWGSAPINYDGSKF